MSNRSIDEILARHADWRAHYCALRLHAHRDELALGDEVVRLREELARAAGKLRRASENARVAETSIRLREAELARASSTYGRTKW